MQTVLLVEDDATVRGVVSQMLTSEGYRVLEAAGESVALKIAETRPEIEVLVSDVILRQGNAIALADQLRYSRPQIKVIYISGYTEDVLQRYGISVQHKNFLQKPFTAAVLAKKIRDVQSAKARAMGGRSES